MAGPDDYESYDALVRRLRAVNVAVEILPDNGFARREFYPWVERPQRAEALAKFKGLLVRGPFPFLRSITVEASHDGVHLRINCVMPERDNQSLTELKRDVTFPYLDALDADFSASDRLREYLHELVTHEIDESILVSGQRVYDPHKHERKTP